MVFTTDIRIRRIIFASALFSWILFLALAIFVIVPILLNKPLLSAVITGLVFLIVLGLVVYPTTHLLFARHHNLDIETDAQSISHVLLGSKVQRVSWSQIDRMRISSLKACVELQDLKGSCLLRLSFLKKNFPVLYAEVSRNLGRETIFEPRRRYGRPWHMAALNYSFPLVSGILLWGAFTYKGWVAAVLFVILILAWWRELASSVSGIQFDQDAMRIAFPFRSVIVKLDEVQAVSIVVDASAGRFGVDTAFALQIQTSRFPEPIRLTALDADVHQIQAEILDRVQNRGLSSDSKTGVTIAPP